MPLTRRDFLKITAIGAGGVALVSLLQRQASGCGKAYWVILHRRRLQRQIRCCGIRLQKKLLLARSMRPLPPLALACAQ